MRAMDLAVFGANGRVGQLVVRRALDSGHRVLAFVHSRDPFPSQDRLRVIAGEVTDGGAVLAVLAALEGGGAVISTLGAFRRGTGPVLTPGMQSITAAMKRTGVRRLVTLTGAALSLPDQRPGLRVRLNKLILTTMDREAVADSEGHLEVLRHTDLEWTTVCAPTIRAEGPSGYRLDATMPLLTGSISGPAVAASLVDLAATGERAREIVGIHRD